MASHSSTADRVKKKWIKNKRNFLYKFHYYRGLNKCAYPPLNIRIEPTNKCNFKCIMCPNGNTDLNDSNSGFIDMDLFNSIIQQASVFPYPTWIILYLGGEPLLHKDIISMIKLCKSKGLLVHFDTNASMLTRTRSNDILTSGIDQISLSFDDVPAAEYEKMRVNSNYDKTLNNILYFLDERKSLDQDTPHVTISSLKLRKTPSDMTEKLAPSNEFTGLFAGYDVSVISNWAHLWAGDSYRDMMYTYERPSPSTTPRCMLPWRDMTINYQGQVVGCCYDLKYDYVIGSVKENNIMELWNNKEMQNLRETSFSGSYDKVKLCRNCSYIYENLDRDIGGRSTRYWNMIKRFPRP